VTETEVNAAVISADTTGIALQPDNANQCQRCLMGRGCGLGLLTSGAAAKPLHLPHARCSSSGAAGLQCGDSVTLKLPERLLLHYVVAVLLIPAILITVTTVAGHTLALHTGLPAVVGGTAGMLSGLIGGAVLARIAGNSLGGRMDQPLIVQRCSALDQE